MKVTVVGAGAVLEPLVPIISPVRNWRRNLFCSILKKDWQKAKPMDMSQTAAIHGFDTKITGTTNDYAKPASSKVMVITTVTYHANRA